MADPKVSAAAYLGAVDSLLGRIGRDAALSKGEVAGLRDELVRDTRAEGAGAIGRMKTARIGGNRVLVPTGENFKKMRLATERTKERFTKFRLKWLDKEGVRKFVDDPRVGKRDKANFFRHSQRLARNARMFLEEIRELEPSLDEEVNETIRQIDDAANDLLKLEVRSFTDLNERLRRVVNGRMVRGPAQEALRTFDVNRNLFNLSMLEHPKAVTRGMLANASERMASRVTKKESLIPKRAFMIVGAPPDAVSKMTKGSRAASVLWRMFSVEQLTKKFQDLGKRGQKSTFRDLGLGFGTPEFYVPVPGEIADEVRAEMRKRRKDFLAQVQAKK